MLELSFNELSIQNANSKAHCVSIYMDFMSLADKINNLKIAPVRIRMSIDLANTSISPENNFTLKDWLKTISNEERQRYLGYIIQDTINVEDPLYFFNDDEAKGFGYAHLNDIASISYGDHNRWVENEYQVSRLSYNGQDGKDSEIDLVMVHHCSSNDVDISHKKWLEQTFLLKKSQIVKNITSIDDFIAKLPTIFSYIDFGKDTSNHIKNLGSINTPEFKKSYRYLLSLDDHLKRFNKGEEAFENYPGDIGNDGENTLDTYGEERKLPTHTGEIFQFSMHAKLGGNLRIYLKPEQQMGRVIIGYIGSHLRTKKFKK